MEDYVLCCSKLDAKPMTLIATRLKDGVEQCCGVVTIEDEDMRLRPEFTPWLTNLYVLPAHRGLGIGKALVGKSTAIPGSLPLSIVKRSAQQSQTTAAARAIFMDRYTK